MRPTRRVLRGFTIIELVVTISIIIVLVGLLVYASTALLLGSEVRRTHDTLKLLDLSLDEWQETSDRTMSFGMQGQPLGDELYDIAENQPLGDEYPPVDPQAPTISRRVMQLLERGSASREMLAKVEAKRIKRTTAAAALLPPAPADGWMDVLDAWDRPVIVILPGRTHLGADEVPPIPPRDDDGTIRTAYETIYGSASNRAVFVSAGPDGQFGDLHLDVPSASLSPQQKKDIVLAADNVYSCEFKGRN